MDQRSGGTRQGSNTEGHASGGQQHGGNQGQQPRTQQGQGQGQGQANPQDAPWADQQQYQEQHAETEDVVVPVGQMKFRVVKMAPKRFATLVERYGIKDMAENLDDVPEQADLSQNPENVDMDDLDGVDDGLRLIKFLRDVVESNVIKPETHWARPDAGGFDLSQLEDEDLMHLVGAITSQDPAQMQQAAEDRVQRYQGNR